MRNLRRMVGVARCAYTTVAGVRVRFAPSPTGQLHLGGMRTALYNWLIARKMKGTFILRIEDTDQTRLVPGAVEQMHSMLDWLSLTPDEGPMAGGSAGPEHAARLLAAGDAYRCFCSPDRLLLMRREALTRREVVRYDRRCAQLTETEIAQKLEAKQAFTIRFVLRETPNTFTDLAYGDIIERIYETEGDPIIMKSDGFPTYHFANVIDDHLMGITHVVRAQEWLQSTVKHCQIYAALHYRPPHFLHVPWLTDTHGRKLSKRQGDVFVETYKANGHMPLALINFVTRNGAGLAGHEPHRIYSLNELVDMFDINLMRQRQPLLFDTSALAECSRRTLQQIPTAALVAAARACFGSHLSTVADDDTIYRRIQYALSEERVSTLQEVCQSPEWQYLPLLQSPPPACHVREWRSPDAYPSSLPVDATVVRQLARELHTALTALSAQTMPNNAYDTVMHVVQPYCTPGDNGRMMRVLRALFIGNVTGPPIRELLDIFSARELRERLEHFLAA